VPAKGRWEAAEAHRYNLAGAAAGRAAANFVDHVFCEALMSTITVGCSSRSANWPARIWFVGEMPLARTQALGNQIVGSA